MQHAFLLFTDEDNLLNAMGIPHHLTYWDLN